MAHSPWKKDPNGFAIDNLTFAPPPATPDDESNLGKPDCPAACAGDPINVGTGNEYQIETDFELPAHTGLSLTRYYNSQDAGSTPFGANWQHLASIGECRQRHEQGHLYARRWPERNVYARCIGGPNVITTLTALYNNGGNHQSGWQVGRSDDSTEQYDMKDQLLSLTTREGLTTVLTYDKKNRLSTVAGPFGHTLTFTYDPTNHVASVMLPSGKLYNYGYDADNNLTTVVYPDNTLRFIPTGQWR